MKIAILSLAIGESYKKAVYPSQQTKMTYCMRHGYDYIDDESVYDKTRPIAWSKILLISKYLPKYDYVVWIDADAMIMDLSQKIEDKLQLMKGKDMMVISDWKMINTGVIFVKNTPQVKEFLAVWYAQTDFLNSHNWEQDALVNIHSTGYGNVHKVLHVNTHRYEAQIQSYTFAYKKGHFILHLAGYRSSKKERIERLAYDLKRFCPVRCSFDTDESYKKRVEWLNNGGLDN